MEKEDIRKTVCRFLVDEIELDEDKLEDDARLKEDLGIDSLDFVDIVVICEREFGFKIKPEEMKNVKTLGQFYDYIGEKLG
ncbi:acyl carrier protein [Muribaculum sp. An289]|nr:MULTISPECIES: acyl carrier protein [unclassified Muribaculum]OUO38015.1 acyl carrier protein [Muribaculum sp. An289]OUO44282.1 acyl carrier protein [Muribaculum sp. An287]